jgi:hypothetical protein
MIDIPESITHSTLDEGYDFFITDQWGIKHHFKISSFPVGTGLQTEAIEVVDHKNGREPYIFNILSDFDSDKEFAELMMREKIKRGVNVRYIDMKDGNWEIGDKLELAGRIDPNSENVESDFDLGFVIDGQKITVEELMRMLGPYGGWNFRLKLNDDFDPPVMMKQGTGTKQLPS